MKSIKQWQEDVHSLAVAKGWYDGNLKEKEVPEMMATLHSEVSEAFEAYRNRDDDLFAEELADIAIRLLDTCEHFNVDLEKEIERKHIVNTQRSYRHGGKRC